MLYGSETWSFTVTVERKSQVFIQLSPNAVRLVSGAYDVMYMQLRWRDIE
jgi:hypothetical protein